MALSSGATRTSSTTSTSRTRRRLRTTCAVPSARPEAIKCATVARQCATVHSGRERSQAVGEGGLEARLSLALSRIVARDSPSGAEGEGFEPSSDPEARNGFRDHFEHADLQGICLRCASGCASATRVGAGDALKPELLCLRESGPPSAEPGHEHPLPASPAAAPDQPLLGGGSSERAASGHGLRSTGSLHACGSQYWASSSEAVSSASWLCGCDESRSSSGRGGRRFSLFDRWGAGSRQIPVIAAECCLTRRVRSRGAGRRVDPAGARATRGRSHGREQD
jgi:hypothetical protein